MQHTLCVLIILLASGRCFLSAGYGPVLLQRAFWGPSDAQWGGNIMVHVWCQHIKQPNESIIRFTGADVGKKEASLSNTNWKNIKLYQTAAPLPESTVVLPLHHSPHWNETNSPLTLKRWDRERVECSECSSPWDYSHIVTDTVMLLNDVITGLNDMGGRGREGAKREEQERKGDKGAETWWAEDGGREREGRGEQVWRRCIKKRSRKWTSGSATGAAPAFSHLSSDA